MAVLVDSGVTLAGALTVVRDQTQHERLSAIIQEVSDQINAGSTLTSALANYPDVFSRLYVAMVRAAETSGYLVEVLNLMSSYLRKESEMAKKLKSAIVYPRFVFIFFLVLLAAIMLFLVPNFKTTFEDLGSELPGATMFLLNLSQFLVDNIIVELVVLAAGMAVYLHLRTTLLGRIIIDKMRLKVPILRDLTLRTAISQFCRTLAISLKSSVPLVHALEIAAETAANKYIREAIKDVRAGIIEGLTLQTCLSRKRIFPTMVVKMVATGEDSGALEKMLNNIAEMYDTEIDRKVTALTSVIEPMLMVGLGVIALIVIIALYLPIFNLGNMNF